MIVEKNHSGRSYPGKIIMSFTQKDTLITFKVEESLIKAIENKTFEVPEGLDNFKIK